MIRTCGVPVHEEKYMIQLYRKPSQHVSEGTAVSFSLFAQARLALPFRKYMKLK